MSQILDYIKRLHDSSVTLAAKIRFDKRVPKQLYLIGLYISLIELTSCIVTLVDKKRFAGIPALFRSFLEAFVDFKNMSCDESYVNYMQAKYHYEWIKVLNQAKGNSNPFLSQFSQWKDLDSQRNEHKTELSKLKNSGYVPLTVYQRFEKAGMTHEYSSLYNFLCSEAHNDIRALMNRHIKTNQSCNDYSVVGYKNQSVSDFAAHLDSTAGLLLESSLRIHSFFGNGEPEELKPFEVELNKLRDKL